MVGQGILLGCNIIHAYLGVNPISHSGPCFWINMHRNGLQYTIIKEKDVGINKAYFQINVYVR